MSERPTVPDRGALPTEQRLDASRELDTLSVRATLELINDQDATVPAAVRRALPQLEMLVTETVARMRRGGRLIYLGAGTSGRLGVLDASECPPTFHCDASEVAGIIAGGDGALRRSSEGAEDDPHGAVAELERLSVNERDVAVGIAASGTTPYVVGALAWALRRGAYTALVTCGSARPQAAHCVVRLEVGPEVLTGSTRMKAGTATKLALNMLSTTVMVQLGKAWGNLMVDLRASNAKLIDRAARILTSQTGLSREAALRLLEEARGRVKTALVMARRNVDAAQAQRLLEAAQGSLRAVIGAPR